MFQRQSVTLNWVAQNRPGLLASAFHVNNTGWHQAYARMYQKANFPHTWISLGFGLHTAGVAPWRCEPPLPLRWSRLWEMSQQSLALRLVEPRYLTYIEICLSEIETFHHTFLLTLVCLGWQLGLEVWKATSVIVFVCKAAILPGSLEPNQNGGWSINHHRFERSTHLYTMLLSSQLLVRVKMKFITDRTETPSSTAHWATRPLN
jgi:hypothetical protein